MQSRANAEATIRRHTKERDEKPELWDEAESCRVIDALDAQRKADMAKIAERKIRMSQMTQKVEAELFQVRESLETSLNEKMQRLQEADKNIDREFREKQAARATKERKILQDKHVEEMILAAKKDQLDAPRGLPPAALAVLAEVRGSQPMLGRGAKSAAPYVDIPRPFTAPQNEGRRQTPKKAGSTSRLATGSTTVKSSTKKTPATKAKATSVKRPGTTATKKRP